MMNLCHRVFYFLREKHVWMNIKQIQDNRPMDAAIIYRGHNKYSNKNTLYVKIKKALKQLQSDNKVTEEQQSVLSKMQRHANFG